MDAWLLLLRQSDSVKSLDAAAIPFLPGVISRQEGEMGSVNVWADGVSIAAMLPAHAPEVLAIYQAGIDEGNATFETVAPAWEQFDRTKLPGHRHVALDHGGCVLGWIAATAVSDRCAYAGVVEHSLYVRPDARGRGIGTTLLNSFIDSTEAAGIWTIQSGIFPENTASLALHTRCGFRVVGRRERIGKHHGGWRDVIMIERRSAIIE